MNFTEFFISFPEMSKESLRLFKKSLDGAYRNFSREYGDAIEAVFDPVLYFLVWFEKNTTKFSMACGNNRFLIIDLLWK